MTECRRVRVADGIRVRPTTVATVLAPLSRTRTRPRPGFGAFTALRARQPLVDDRKVEEISLRRVLSFALLLFSRSATRREALFVPQTGCLGRPTAVMTSCKVLRAGNYRPGRLLTGMERRWRHGLLSVGSNTPSCRERPLRRTMLAP